MGGDEKMVGPIFTISSKKYLVPMCVCVCVCVCVYVCVCVQFVCVCVLVLIGVVRKRYVIK